MIFLALFGWLFLFTQQLQFVLGYDPLQAGVRCLPFALTMGVASAQSAKVAARIGTKLVVTSGLALMAVGFGLMSTSTVHTGYPFLLVASVIVAAGMGLAMAPATESIMGSLPRISGRRGLGGQRHDPVPRRCPRGGAHRLGRLLGLRQPLPSRPRPPAGPYVAEAKASVGAAVTIAGQHAPGSFGQVLVDAARQAFVAGSDRADARRRRGRYPRFAGRRPVPAGSGFGPSLHS